MELEFSFIAYVYDGPQLDILSFPLGEGELLFAHRVPKLVMEVDLIVWSNVFEV